MNPNTLLYNFYTSVVQEATVGSSHISLYMALYLLWSRNNCASPILIKRHEVMRLAKIGSSATYHKCLKVLIEIGCVVYQPSSNPALKSKVYLIRRDKYGNANGNADAKP